MSKKNVDLKPKNLNFSLRRTMAIAFRTMNQFRRDRRTIALMSIVPIVIMLIFGLAFSGEVRNVPVIIDNQDVLYTNPFPPISLHLGPNITDNLVADDGVDVTFGNYDQGIDSVELGDVYAAVLIPANFSELVVRMLTGENVTIQLYVYIDATKPTIRASVMSTIYDALDSAVGDRGIKLVQILAHDGAEFTGLDVGIPSVIAFVIIFLLVIVGTITVTREKIQGTQDRLYSTPLRSSERLLGYVIGLLLIAILMISLTLIFGVLVFGVKVHGNVFLLIFAALIFGIAHVFLAVFLSNFAQNELQAIQFAPLTALPSMALGGMLVPIVSLPVWLQPLSYVVPLTYGINLFEGIMLKGWGFKELWVDFTVVAGMCLLFFILAVVTVRNRMRD
ncbi:MAG: ABC transporter permease [Candidatus Heimdallarchaeota archaeon]|nr:ABC transporter permease [Candidatus Heimdallarchaeota archaeon]MCG3256014.1 ABC transporter permease [Candidatus Heimdallarchaeota archaeon]MCK4611084.1 ABC transporter permease [Candidatus Heimdallarchaeota archaeon]